MMGIQSKQRKSNEWRDLAGFGFERVSVGRQAASWELEILRLSIGVTIYKVVWASVRFIIKPRHTAVWLTSLP